MRKLKTVRISGLLLLGIMLFFLPTEINAEEIDELVQPVELTQTEQGALLNLGFTDQEISTMTDEEYQSYANLDGELTAKEIKHYKVTEYENGESEMTQVTEREALRGIMNNQITPFATDTKKNSWMTLTLSSSKLSNGNILLKNSFKWANIPAITLKDVVAITHSATAVKVPSTQKFVYKYTDGKGTHTRGATSFTPSAQGTAAKFDIVGTGKNAPPRNQNGYLSFQVKKGNKNDIRANAYGHYHHVTLGITGTITLKPGSISVGGVSKVSKAGVPMILFNY